MPGSAARPQQDRVVGSRCLSQRRDESHAVPRRTADVVVATDDEHRRVAPCPVRPRGGGSRPPVRLAWPDPKDRRTRCGTRQDTARACIRACRPAARAASTARNRPGCWVRAAAASRPPLLAPTSPIGRPERPHRLDEVSRDRAPRRRRCVASAPTGPRARTTPRTCRPRAGAGSTTAPPRSTNGSSSPRYPGRPKAKFQPAVSIDERRPRAVAVVTMHDPVRGGAAVLRAESYERGRDLDVRRRRGIHDLQPAGPEVVPGFSGRGDEARHEEAQPVALVLNERLHHGVAVDGTRDKRCPDRERDRVLMAAFRREDPDSRGRVHHIDHDEPAIPQRNLAHGALALGDELSPRLAVGRGRDGDRDDAAPRRTVGRDTDIRLIVEHTDERSGEVVQERPPSAIRVQVSNRIGTRLNISGHGGEPAAVLRQLRIRVLLVCGRRRSFGLRARVLPQHVKED